MNRNEESFKFQELLKAYLAAKNGDEYYVAGKMKIDTAKLRRWMSGDEKPGWILMKWHTFFIKMDMSSDA